MKEMDDSEDTSLSTTSLSTTSLSTIAEICETTGCSMKDAKDHLIFNRIVSSGKEKGVDTAIYSGDQWRKMEKISTAQLNAILKPPRSANKSTEKCKKCGRYNVMFQEIQMRSIDEPPTIFYLCTNYKCNATWRVDP